MSKKYGGINKKKLPTKNLTKVKGVPSVKPKKVPLICRGADTNNPDDLQNH